jgi:apolipoprotein N-acyltransferase
LLKLPNILLALFSGLLLGAAWYISPLISFIGFIPLLILEDKISSSLTKRKALKILGLSYLTFFIWNLITTWWIYFASLEGALIALFCNSLFMCIVFTTWSNIKSRINKSWAVWLLIPLWLGFEYGHSLWELTWTWLTLGNVFAFSHNLVQWYEFTGTSGGGLWILVLNILIFKIIQSLPKTSLRNKFNPDSYRDQSWIRPGLVILIPIIFSLIIKWYRSSSPNSELSTLNSQLSTVIVQPNVDPYNEKFYVQPEIQLQNLLKQLEGKIDSNTKYLVLPETFLTESISENDIEASPSILFLKETLLAKFPDLTIITGSNSEYTFGPGEKLSATARRWQDFHYDAFNTALQINKAGINIYHKSILVPGVEIMPYASLFKPLEKYALQLGGTFGSLGKQEERTVFYNQDKSVGVAPVICYESVYPDFVAKYIRNGANVIFIMTNDGWWQDTPGYKQHLAYAKLRAIETRCQIARCANTGISCFIDELGNIEQPTGWWEKAIISKNINVNNNKTFFVRFGDLISYSSAFLAILIVLYGQFLRFRK